MWLRKNRQQQQQHPQLQRVVVAGMYFGTEICAITVRLF